MNQRLVYFDQMKGVAIILVVIGHVMQFSFGYNPSDVVKMLSIFHMPIFFYISGYLLYNKTPNCREMLIKFFKRILNLLVPFFVFAALWCVFSDENYIKLILDGGRRYWFLWILFLLSAFFIVYGFLLQNIKKEWLYVFMWLIPYLVIICGKFYENRYGRINAINFSQLNTYYRYFLVGYLCHKYTQIYEFLFKNDIIYAFGFILYFLQWRYCDMHNIALIFLGGIGAIVVLQRYFENKQNSNSWLLKLLSNIGQASLSIFVIHYFLIPNVSSIMHVYLDVQNPFIWQLTFALLLAVPIIAVSMFVGKLIENNRYLKFVLFGKI